MIRAVIFDLDGTLVQTERLKAISYSRAAAELSGNGLAEGRALEAFKDVVGRTREEVAGSLLERLGLHEAARARTAEFGVALPWEAFAEIRLRIYAGMLADDALLRDHRLPQAIGLLQQTRRAGLRTALASMSHRDQVHRVLAVLGLDGAFDVVAARDDVLRGKPDPEIYHLVAGRLGLDPRECLVIEDSASGVAAALAAGMWCIAVTTEFTRDGVHAGGRLDRRWIVDDHSMLDAVAAQMLAIRARE